MGSAKPKVKPTAIAVWSSFDPESESELESVGFGVGVNLGVGVFRVEYPVVPVLLLLPPVVGDVLEVDVVVVVEVALEEPSWSKRGLPLNVRSNSLFRTVTHEDSSNLKKVTLNRRSWHNRKGILHRAKELVVGYIGRCWNAGIKFISPARNCSNEVRSS